MKGQLSEADKLRQDRAKLAWQLIAPSQVEALDEIEIIGTIRTSESLTLLLDSFIADYKLEGDKALETLRGKLIA